MSIKLFLVEDHSAAKQAIRSLLENESEIIIVGEADNCKKAITQLKKAAPDLVLIDLDKPVVQFLDCIHELKEQFPHIHLLVLSLRHHENYLIELLDAGADGYLLRSSTHEELLFAIRRVADGKRYIGSEFTLNMLEKYKLEVGVNKHCPLDVSLSERENQILELIATGMTNAEMAKKLFISIRTIESHRKKLLEKTGTTNTATLIKFSLQKGLIR